LDASQATQGKDLIDGCAALSRLLNDDNMLERFSSQGEQAWLGAYDRVSTVVLPELHSDEPPTLDRSPSQIFNSFDTSEFERRAEQAKALLQRCGLNFEAAMDMNTPRGHTPRAHPRSGSSDNMEVAAGGEDRMDIVDLEANVMVVQIDDARGEELRALQRDLAEDRKRLVNFILRTTQGSMSMVPQRINAVLNDIRDLDLVISDVLAMNN